MELMSEELKPCPFCGGEAAAFNGSGEWFAEWWCRCLTCKSSTRLCTSGAHAIAAWNTRAAAPEMAEALEGFLSWANKACPCRDDSPSPCPLCGARVDAFDENGVCKAAEYTIPAHLLTAARAALAKARGR